MARRGKKKANRPLWGGGYAAGPADAVLELSASIDFDKALAPYDIAGSIAHAEMLGQAGIISRASSRRIVAGLRSLARKVERGSFRWDRSLEDVHMNIEAALTRAIGEDGKRLHTGRSRNDQVTTAFRLYAADSADEIRRRTATLGQILSLGAKQHAELLWPGYTHFQPAQPVTFGHLLAAHAEAVLRDCERLTRAEEAALAQCPLGSGALAGTTLPLDRAYVAQRLGFRAVSPNTQDSVSDRDFALDLLYAIALLFLHLSRLAEEIVLFSSMKLIRLDDRVTTGSSLMPQKKNPDVAELARGKTGRAFGNLMRLLTVLKGLPLAYNRDMQEDKEALFDSVDAARKVLPAFTLLLATMELDAERALAAIDPASLATDLAEFLVEKGMPFREAHEIVASLVSRASRAGVPFDAAAREAFPASKLSTHTAVSRRSLPGGPAPARVRAEAARLAKEFRTNARAAGASKALSLLRGAPIRG